MNGFDFASTKPNPPTLKLEYQIFEDQGLFITVKAVLRFPLYEALFSDRALSSKSKSPKTSSPYSLSPPQSKIIFTIHQGKEVCIMILI